MKKNTHDIPTALLLFIFCGMGLYGILTTPTPLENDLVGPMNLPWLAVTGCALCAIILFLRGLFFAHQNQEKELKKTILDVSIIKTLCYYVFFVLYLLSMVYLGDYFLHTETSIVPFGGGFSIASSIFLLCSLYALGRKNIREIFCISFTAVAALVVIFGNLFHIMLP